MTSGRSAEFLTHPRADWVERAACRNQGLTDIFYVKPGAAIWDALAYCARCTVRKECLQFAIDNGIEDGVWGGKSVRARRDPDRRWDDVPVPTQARIVELWEQHWSNRRIARELKVTEQHVYAALRRYRDRSA